MFAAGYYKYKKYINKCIHHDQVWLFPGHGDSAAMQHVIMQ